MTNTNVRKPEAILTAMDKDGVRDNSNLLTQLSAELQVSLSIEADEVSKRNLKIATISCIVAGIALLITIIQVGASLCA
jgi:hypothetical protein